jgi:hypothetical protein
MAIIWPQMVAVLFTVGGFRISPYSCLLTILLQDDGGASMRAGWLNAIPGFSIVCGQVLSGGLTVLVGHAKYQCMVVLSLGGAFLAGESSILESDHPSQKKLTTDSHGVLHTFYTGWFILPDRFRIIFHWVE